MFWLRTGIKNLPETKKNIKGNGEALIEKITDTQHDAWFHR